MTSDELLAVISDELARWIRESRAPAQIHSMMQIRKVIRLHLNEWGRNGHEREILEELIEVATSELEGEG